MLKTLKKLQHASRAASPEHFDTLVGCSTHIHGRLLLVESARIDGKVIGDVETVPENNVTVVIGALGEVIGNISAYRVVVAGKVRGNIDAVERVELQQQCQVRGDISYGALSVYCGARLQGLVIQKENEPKTAQATEAITMAAGAAVAQLASVAAAGLVEPERISAG